MGPTIYTYNLGPTPVEVDRLEFQHHAVFKPLTDGLLPTDIRQYLASLGRAPAVADIATGTGVWLSDMATEFSPDARLDGYDVEPAKFPPASQLPANVKLSPCDVLLPFAEDLHGQYDLVHVRLLITALNAEQWPIVAANLRSLLRPGGYLLWAESGYPSISCLPMTEHFQKLINVEVRYAAAIGRDITAPANLLQHVKSQGYTDCYQTSFSTYGKGKVIQDLAGRTMLSTLRQGLLGMVLQGGFDWVKSTRDVEDIMGLVHRDLENGVCAVGFEVHCIIGRQPS
ncbi:methyltransferase domain-containing protein, partial [Metarhizium majus ARSEF 297]